MPWQLRGSLNKWQEYEDGIPEMLARESHAAALRVVDFAFTNSRFEFGGLREGWYAITPFEDGYAAALAASTATDTRALVLNSVRRRSGPYESLVSNARGHALPHEVGTAFLAPNPVLTQGLEMERTLYPEGIRDAWTRFRSPQADIRRRIDPGQYTEDA